MTDAVPQFAPIAPQHSPTAPVRGAASTKRRRERFPIARIVRDHHRRRVIVDCAYANSTHVLENEAFEAIGPSISLDELRERCGNDPALDRDGTVSFSETFDADHLQIIQIETLLKCNLSCAYCYCAAGKARSEALTGDGIRRVLAQAAAMGVLGIDFTGGEFLLRPDWRELVLAARALGLNVSIHTNGTALNERNVTFIAEAGVHRLQVSVDGHTPELHDGIRGGNASFAKTMEGVRLLKRANVPVHFALMVHKGNIDQFGDIFEFYTAMGTTVLVDMIAAFGSELNARTGVTPKEYYEATIGYIRRSGGDRRINRVMKCGAEQNWSLKDYKPHCGIGHSYMFITATGEMAICPQMTSREDVTLFGGPNIADMSVDKAWRTSEFFARHRHANCSNVEKCPAGTVCRGGCRADAYALTGDYRAPDVVECNHYKNPGENYVDFQARYERGDLTLPAATARDERPKVGVLTR